MNNVNKKLKKADFIPVYNENSDFKKVSEYDLVKVNSIIVPVMNIICMEKGSNQLFPNMGVKNILMSIPFKERDEIDEVLYAVSSGITEYISSSVSVTLDQEKTNLKLLLILKWKEFQSLYPFKLISMDFLKYINALFISRVEYEW